MQDHERLLDIIDGIYDAVVDEAVWPDLIAKMQSHLGIDILSIPAYEDAAQHAVRLTSGYDEARTDYLNYWWQHDIIMRKAFETDKVNTTFFDWIEFPKETLKADSYYQEYRRKYACGHFVGHLGDRKDGSLFTYAAQLPIGRHRRETMPSPTSNASALILIVRGPS